MNRLTIIGASGHGKVVADIAKLNGYKDIVFLDDNETVKECNGYPVVGNTRCNLEGDVFVAIGNPNIRKNLMERYSNHLQPILIHPSAIIAEGVTIGNGTVVMAGTVINSCSEIGNGVIVNTASSIDHDCIVKDYCHISVGAHLAGTVTVGTYTWVGAGATIINNISVCDNCLIGAGGVVIRDINISGKYVGVPAHFIGEE